MDERRLFAKERKQAPRTWDQLYEALKAYKEEHGDVEVTRHHPDSGLLWWICRQRRDRHKLTPLQRRKLEEIGFDLSTIAERREKAWNENFDRLKEYRLIYGDCNVPQTAKFDPALEEWATELGVWVSELRKQYRLCKLSPERRAKLDAIEFAWVLKPHSKEKDSTKTDEKWHEKFLSLVDFHSKHGHCLVSSSAGSEDPKLGFWVLSQRQLYSEGRLKHNRKQLLDELQFCWKIDRGDADASLNQKDWDRQLERLQQFKEEYGTVDVPGTYERFGLGSWLQRQKQLEKKGRLDPRRRDKLAALNVTWSVDFEQRWSAFYDRLKAFHQSNGHCLPSSKTELGRWASDQRFRQKEGLLSQERKEKLDTLGFTWGNVNDERSEKAFQRLCSYRTSHGCFPPPSDSLYNWMIVQRQLQKTGALPSYRKRKLDELDFEWGDVKENRWEGFFFKLKSFRDRHGYFPRRSDELYEWVTKQRLSYKRDTLRLDRMKQLESIGFTWDNSLDERWEVRFQELVAFKQSHGFFPHQRKHDLYIWVCDQRRLFKCGTLLPERQAKLIGIGFSWEGDYNARWLEKFHKVAAFKKKNEFFPCSRKHELHSWVLDQRRYQRTGQLREDRKEMLNSIGFEWFVTKGNKKRKKVEAADEGSNATGQDDLQTWACSSASPPQRKRQKTAQREKVRRGDRVAVYWSEDDAFYPGTVSRCKNSGRVYIHYDDGDDEWLAPGEKPIKSIDDAVEGDLRKRDAISRIRKGDRLSVWWPVEHEYYSATIAMVDEKRRSSLLLKYDDGDEEWLDLTYRKFVLHKH